MIIFKKQRTKIQNQNSKNGFSLIELLLVLFIISLSVALSVPAINTGLNHLEIKGAAKYLATTLRYARNQAISEKTAYYVKIDANENKVIILHDDKQFERELNISEDIIKIVDVSKERIDESIKSKTISFYPRGSSSGGTFEIWDKKGQPAYRLIVKPSNGKIKVETL